MIRPLIYLSLFLAFAALALELPDIYIPAAGRAQYQIERDPRADMSDYLETIDR